ncbi:TPA: DUF4238 domain-containing protein [Enterobacter asburiae]|nr:DUF4238 domain-containing protein [Enterobacter asburiae]HDR2799071.1 DUF4238 domain-containing protein [Enterobacter asburiae]
MKSKCNKKNNSQQKGDHHFIPQVYIQRFYDEEIESVWRGKFQYKETKYFTSAKIFYVHKLYNLKLLGKEFTEIEDTYGKIENELANVYNMLDEIENLNVLNNEKEANINLFSFIKTIILTQYFRTDDMLPEMFREKCQNLVKTYISKDAKFKKEFNYIKIEELRVIEKLIKKGIKKDKKYTNELIKGLQHSILPLLLSNFYSGGLVIKRIKTKKYISSDKPVVCKNIDDILNLRNFIYPLAPNILVYALGDDVTEDMIKDENKVNDFICDNAISYIISHDKATIENYMKK